MHFHQGELACADVQALLREHLDEMHATSPPESVHALDQSALQEPGVEFFTARDAATGDLLGCAALRRLDLHHVELKSMRTASSARRRGVGAALLNHLLVHAQRAGYQRMSLETGSTDNFQPALRLYERSGFEPCGPFSDYEQDPFSVFMTRRL